MDVRVPSGTTPEELAAVLAVLGRPAARREDATRAWRRARLAARRVTPAEDGASPDWPHPGRRGTAPG